MLQRVLLSIGTKYAFIWVRERKVFQVSDPRAGYAGQIRGSAETTRGSRILARPASDPFLVARTDPTREHFITPLDLRPDPTREI